MLKLASITRGGVVLGLGQVVGRKILRARLETWACQCVASWDRRRPPRGLTWCLNGYRRNIAGVTLRLEYHTVLGGGE